MKIAAWLKREGVKRYVFANRIGMSPPYVTALCNGTIWPSRGVAERIAAETKGEVTANDFADTPRARRDRRPSSSAAA